MLYALGDPVAFLALVAGFLLALVARGLSQAALTQALGGRSFELKARLRLDPRRHIDPFGAVAAILAGPGWGSAAPIEGLLGRFSSGGLRGRAARRVVLVLVAGPLSAGAIAVLAFLGFLALDTGLAVLDAGTYLGAVKPSRILHGNDLGPLSQGSKALLCAGMGALALAVMELLPIPPLDGGRLVLALGPTTLGWQRLRHWADQNWGLIVLFVLLLLPLGPEGPLLLVLVNVLGEPLLDLLSS